MKNFRRACLALVFAFILAPLSATGAEEGPRTFDQLTTAELDQLSKLTLNYYMCVADKTLALKGADTSTPERIFATYPPHILIFRQQCRISLINLEKELYTQGLNPEFITNHVMTLRDDVVHFALQQTLKKAEEEKENALRKNPATENSEADRKPNLGALGTLLGAPEKK